MVRNLITRFCRWWLEPKRLPRKNSWIWYRMESTYGSGDRLPEPTPPPRGDYAAVIRLSRAELESLLQGPITITKEQLLNQKIDAGGEIG